MIVSRLRALVRNQVESAARAGIRACTINSANPEEWDTIYEEVDRGCCCVNSPGVADKRLSQSGSGELGC